MSTLRRYDHRMWKFVGTCGHTVNGWIQQLDEHVTQVHQPGEKFQYDMYNPATDDLMYSFEWPPY